MPTAPTPDLAIYAGYWIAIVRGRVVASGSTAHETFLNCRAMRLKDEPILKFIPSKRLRAANRTQKKTK